MDIHNYIDLHERAMKMVAPYNGSAGGVFQFGGPGDASILI
jgi:hypothetical protein